MSERGAIVSLSVHCCSGIPFPSLSLPDSRAGPLFSKWVELELELLWMAQGPSWKPSRMKRMGNP